jgi:hypothetical protein
MLAKTAMTVPCTAGIVFYLRFPVALCKESKPRWSGYWVHLRFGSGEGTLAELPKWRKPVTRAA